VRRLITNNEGLAADAIRRAPHTRTGDAIVKRPAQRLPGTRRYRLCRANVDEDPDTEGFGSQKILCGEYY